MAALAVLAALAATPALAMDVAGFYAGIYGGVAQRNDAGIDYSLTSGSFGGPGPVESPSSIVNSGIDPDLFDVMNKVLAEFPFAYGGSGGGLIANGAMAFDRTALTGGVVGYGFGNGVRIELDYSRAQFEPSTIAFTDSTNEGALGTLGPGDQWTWFSLGALPQGPMPATDASLIVPATTFYTEAEFLLVNGWYDFGTGTVMTPYVGGGAGIARISTLALSDCGCGATTEFGEDTAYVPAAQLGGGVKIRLADPVSLDLGYRLKLAASSEVGFTYIDQSFFPGFQELGLGQSGVIAVHTLTAGLTFALQ